MRQPRPATRKIRNFARTAAAEGLEYFWADTCCIDGSSSSELQESINSMFQWYEDAALCLVYLEDFEWSEDEKEALRAGPGGPGVVEVRSGPCLAAWLSLGAMISGSR